MSFSQSFVPVFDAVTYAACQNYCVLLTKQVFISKNTFFFFFFIGGETLDECGLKFLLAVRLHTFLTTSLPAYRAQLLHQGNFLSNLLKGNKESRRGASEHLSLFLPTYANDDIFDTF